MRLTAKSHKAQARPVNTLLLDGGKRCLRKIEEGRLILPMMLTHDRTMVFADGENLVLRYQDCIAAGAYPEERVCHIANALLWHPLVTYYMRGITRVSYYTTHSGDSLAIDELTKKIAAVEYTFPEGLEYPPSRSGRLVPRVFKKEGRSAKTKSVDINITIDALRHTHDNSLDTAIFLTGDGDYIPLFEEIMRHGKRVIVGAFQNGCHPRLTTLADRFIDLDAIFFRSRPSS